jgi:hypothetical protein
MTNAPLWVLIASAVGASGLVAGIIGLISIVYQARTAQPKNSAETASVRVDSQEKIIQRHEKDAERAWARAQAAELKADQLEVKVDQMQAELKQMRRMWQESRRREGILAAHNQALAAWCDRFIATQPPGLPHPPKLQDFERAAT